MLFWIPILGCILCGIAIYKLYRHRGGWYMLALISAIPAIILTVVGIMIFIFTLQLA